MSPDRPVVVGSHNLRDFLHDTQGQLTQQRVLLLRFLIATTDDVCYTEETNAVRRDAASLLGLPPPPNASWQYEDAEAWERAVRAVLATTERRTPGLR